jgi:hypothetical protein
MIYHKLSSVKLGYTMILVVQSNIIFVLSVLES